MNNIVSYDHKVHNWVQKKQNPVLVYFFTLFTGIGSGYFWLPVYACLYVFGSPKAQYLVLLTVAAELLGLLIVIVIRNYFPRARPKRELKFLVAYPWNKKSFPSQHALRSGMLATIGGTHFPFLFFLIVGIALLIALSRIYLQWHYLSDVIVGFAIGILCAIFVMEIQNFVL